MDIELLKKVDIFKDLDEDQIKSVASLGYPLQIQSGFQLGAQGQAADFLYIIIHGKAKLSAQSDYGEITVRIAGPGESLPLAAVIGSNRLITTITAFTELELFALPKHPLTWLCQERPEIGMRIYMAMAEVLAERYNNTLKHFATTAEMAKSYAEIWANV